MNDIDLIADAYYRHKSVWRAGKELGIAGQTVHKYLRKHNLIPKMKKLSNEAKEKIERLYKKGFHSGDGQLINLCRELGFSRLTVGKYAKTLGLTTLHRKRTPEYAAKMFSHIQKDRKINGHPRGMLGIRHTPETIAKISESSKINWSRMSNKRKIEKTRKMIETKIKNGNLAPHRIGASWKSGWRIIGGEKKFYRSRWESNYARYLEWLKQHGEILSWEHEPKTFWFKGIKRGCVSYLPDFLVIENNGKNVYHEVKGWMDKRSKIKIKRMAKYFPEISLLIIDAKQYQVLKKQMSLLIPDWESGK